VSPRTLARALASAPRRRARRTGANPPIATSAQARAPLTHPARPRGPARRAPRGSRRPERLARQAPPVQARGLQAAARPAPPEPSDRARVTNREIQAASASIAPSDRRATFARRLSIFRP